MKFKGTVLFIIWSILIFTACGGGGGGNSDVYETTGTPQWAKTVTTGPDNSSFYSVAVDGSGNIYAAGYIYGSTEFDFGNSVTVTGVYTNANILLVKYNSAGTAQWAKTVTTGPDISLFESVIVDSNGNIYAAGRVMGTNQYGFGNSVTATASNASDNILLVKYNSSGTAQWAKTVTTGPDLSRLYSVAVDGSGNIYTVGYIQGTDPYGFGNSVTAEGGYNGSNILLVKYNSAGTAQWAKTVTTGENISRFFSVAIDADGNIYAVGYIYGSTEFDFGNSVKVSGKFSTFSNILLVKYNSAGNAQWAKSVTTGEDRSQFYSVAVDGSGNIYAAGSIYGSSEFDFGNSVTATGDYVNANIVLVKYNSSGTAQWAKTVTTGLFYSEFESVVYGNENIYATGVIYGNDQYYFGNSVTATGEHTGTNILIVKYK